MTAKSIIEQVAENRAADRKAKEQRAVLLDKMEVWKAEGYVVSCLQGLESGDMVAMQQAYDRFQHGIGELGVLRARLEGLDRKGFESDFAGLEAGLRNPERIDGLRREIESLEGKIERKKDMLREEARQHELRLREEARLIAQVKAKREQENRMRKEYEAKLKEERNKRAQLAMQQRKEKRLEKELHLKEKHIDLKAKKADTLLKKREAEKAKYEYNNAKAEIARLEKETRIKEEERLRSEKEFEIKLQERIRLELESKKLEEERMNLELQAKTLEEEKQLKELETQRLKEERLCKELGLMEAKAEQKLAKLESKREKAEAERLAREAKVREEKRRLRELNELGKRREMAIAAAEARKAMEERMKIEAQAQKIRERKHELVLAIEKKKLEARELAMNLKNIEKEVKGVKTSLKKLETEGIAVGAVSVSVKKKGAMVKIEVPKSIEGWEGIFEYWDAPEAEKLVPEIEKLSDKDIVTIMNWMNTDEAAMKGCNKLINKWNTDNRYFTVYDRDKNIVQVKRTFIGGLFALSEILAGKEVMMYPDTIRYWQPLLDLYEKNRPIYDFPPIERTDYELSGEILAKYSKK